MVMASVNVETGVNQPTIHQLLEVLGDVSVINRTSIMVNGQHVGAGDALFFRDEQWIRIEQGPAAELLVFDFPHGAE